MNSEANKTEKKATITEEQARALLAEETLRLKNDRRKAEAQGRKVLMIGIIVGALLLLFGIGVCIVAAMNGDDSDNSQTTSVGSSNNDKREETTGGDKTPADNRIVEVDLADPDVQELYTLFGDMQVATGTARFYTDEGFRNGRPDDDFMVNVAVQRLAKMDCKIERTPEALAERYGSEARMLDDEALAMYLDNACLNGTEVVDKVEEIFGRKITLTEKTGDKYIVGALKYDPKYDELYPTMSGIGGIYPEVIRGLYRAEKSNDHIYLYEAVGKVFNDKLYQIDERCDMTWDASKCGVSYDVTGETAIDQLITHKAEIGDYKWIFQKNADGKYVFSGVEKLNK